MQSSIFGRRMSADAQAVRKHVAAPAASPEVHLKGFYLAISQGGRAGSNLLYVKVEREMQV